MTTDIDAADAMFGEARMLPSLTSFLYRTRRVRDDSILVAELPWRGRRVDFVTLTSTGISSAYELKIGSFGRVLEQAIYNGLSFDRTWVVVPALPKLASQRLAESYNVGIIVAEPKTRVLRLPGATSISTAVRTQVRNKIRSHAAGGRSRV